MHNLSCSVPKGEGPTRYSALWASPASPLRRTITLAAASLTERLGRRLSQFSVTQRGRLFPTPKASAEIGVVHKPELLRDSADLQLGYRLTLVRFNEVEVRESRTRHPVTIDRGTGLKLKLVPKQAGLSLDSPWQRPGDEFIGFL